MTTAMPFVLMYHSVAPDRDDPFLITVTPARFEQQMHWLHRQGLRGASVHEVIAHPDGQVGLTFDDGYEDFAQHVMPVLSHYGFTATVFVLAGRFGGDNGWETHGPRKSLLHARQVREIADAGLEIGSHGLRHVHLAAADRATVLEEADRSRTILQIVSGQPVTGFCYPYGDLDDPTIDAVRNAGYDYGCAVSPGSSAGRFAIPRTYIGDRDATSRMTAKRLRHKVIWRHQELDRALART